MAKFRNRPVVIDAVQLLPSTWDEMKIFAGVGPAKLGMPHSVVNPMNAKQIMLAIPTLEGEMTASEGDWIIRGVKNELCSCKDEIFKLTYEPV